MRKLLVGLIIIVSMFVAGNVFVAPKARAEVAPGCGKSFLGLPPWYKYLDVGPRTVQVENQKVGSYTDPCAINGPSDNGQFLFDKAIPRVILAVIDIMLRIAGMVTVAFVIYGGFRYMTSQGEPDALKQAQGTIINALIGLAIAVLSVSIVSFVGGNLW